MLRMLPPAFIAIVFCFGCKAKYDVKEEGITQKPISCREFSFPLNGDSVTSFGFEATSDVDVVSPRAISIDQDQCYLIDPLYNRVKRISFRDGRIESSQSLPDSIGRINDCIIVGGQIVATSTNGAVIIFDSQLMPTFIRKVSRGNGSLIGRSGNNFVSYFPSDELKTISMNMSGEVVDVRQGRQDLKNKIHGKPFRIAGDTIYTDTHKYSIGSVNYSPNKYGGINLDYIETGMAFFVVEETQLKLHFCTY